MEIFFIVLSLCILGALSAKKSSEKPEVLLDCSDKICQWNDNQPCPYRMVRYKGSNGGFRRRVDGIHECCNTRQIRMRMAKLILDGKINTQGSQIIDDARAALERHKLEYPEEHKFLFG